LIATRPAVTNSSLFRRDAISHVAKYRFIRTGELYHTMWKTQNPKIKKSWKIRKKRLT
jgi:hypothetical protein